MGSLFKRLAGFLGGTVAASLAAIFGTIAVSSACYGLLAQVLGQSGAAAVTALAFGLIVVGLGLLTPGLLGVRPAATGPASRRKVSAADTRMAMEIGAAALGVVTDLMLERRLGNGKAKRNRARESARRPGGRRASSGT